MPLVLGCGASIMVNSIPAALAAWAAAVMGPAIPPMEVTIVIMEVRILSLC